MENNKPSQRLQSILFMSVVCFILVFSAQNVSAAEWDNGISNYDEHNEIITFKNGCTFGIGWTCLGSEIGQVQLKTPNNYYVASGYNYVWEMDAWVYSDYNDFLKQFEYLDMKSKVKVNRDLDIKILSYKDVEVNDYNLTCGNNTGELGNCYYEIIGSHIEQKEVWNKVTPADLKKNEKVTLRGYTNVQKGDNVDWSPVIFGVRVDHDIWAEWTESLDVDLGVGYKLDGAGATAVDVLGVNAGTLSGGVTQSVTGIIGDAYDFDGTDGKVTSAYTTWDDGANAVSVSMWVKFDVITNSKRIISKGSVLNLYPQNNHIAGDITGSGSPTYHVFEGSTALNTSAWFHVCYTFESGNSSIFLNGAFEDSDTDALTINSDVSAWNLGVDGSDVQFHDGDIDEVYVWERTLSSDECVDLFNDGYGITFGSVSAPSVTLISPANESNTTSSTQEFVVTVTDDLKVDNVTLYLDGASNITNTSNINGSYIFTVSGLAEGVHTWNILAYDNNSAYNQSTNWTFNFTQPPIYMDLLSPADTSTHENPAVNMSCRAYKNEGVIQLNLTINGITNQTITNSTPAENLSIDGNINFSEGNYTWGCSAYNLDTSATSANRTFEVLYSNPVVELISPTNDSSTTNPNITFAFNATDSNGIANVSLYIDDILNTTNTSGIAGDYSIDLAFADGDYNWSAIAVSIFGKSTTSTTWLFQVHTTEPEVSVTAPVGALDFITVGDNITLEYEITESGENLTEHIDSCWYDYAGNYEDEFLSNSSSGSTHWNYINGTMTSSGGVNKIRDDTSLPSGTHILRTNAATNYLRISAFQDSVPICNELSYSISAAYSSATTGYYACIQDDANFSWIIKQIDWDSDGGTFESKFSAWNYSLYLNCSASSIDFSYQYGFNDIIVYASDTFGLMANDATNWSHNLTEISQTYPTTSIESSTETYTANVSYNSDLFDIITGTLWIGGEGFLGTKVTDGEEIFFTAVATMPGVEVETNETAYWIIYLTDDVDTYEFNLTSNNVTISPINLTLCGEGLNVSFWNFTILNESNFAEINASFEVTFDLKKTGSTTSSLFSYADTNENKSQYDFCIDPPYESYTLDTTIQLTKNGYVTKFYNYEEIVVTNATVETNLYMLLSGDSTSFIVHVVDVKGADIQEAEVRVQRYYPGSGEWITTEILTTDDAGESVGHLVSEDADYRFLVYQSGTNVYNSSSTKITCTVAPCTVTLVIPLALSTGFETVENLDTSLTYNTNTNIFTYTYSDTSGDFTRTRLYVIRLAPSNSTLVMPCNETKTTSVGVMTCSIVGQINGTYQASAYILRDSSEFLVERMNGILGTQPYDSMGDDGILWSIFIFIGIVMLGISRPSLAIIFGTVGLITLSLIGIINIGAVSIVAISAIAFILLIRVGKE